MATLTTPVLELENLTIHLPTAAGVVRAVEDFNLTIGRGEKWRLVGESGCGKTILALGVLRLLPAGARISGTIKLSGIDVTSLSARELTRIRGREAALIFEQPASCLHPLLTVGDQVAEAVLVQEKIGRRAAWKKAVNLLDRVRLPAPEKRAGQYPSELSGGMVQKVMIAMALARKPKLIIADEPTTALDVSVQVQIVELLEEVLAETGASLLLISHDPDAARGLCGHAAVMYAGRLVDLGLQDSLLTAPRHPYAQALFAALSGNEPRPIPGRVPSLTDLPPGCAFHPRCPAAQPRCGMEEPLLIGNVRCHRQAPCSE
ncbi:MAG: ABC transporter ATP-binding protein [Pseudomonadota bacterium]